MTNQINTKREDVTAAFHLTTALVMMVSSIAIFGLGVWGRTRGSTTSLLNAANNEVVDFAQVQAPIALISCGVIFFASSIAGVVFAFLGLSSAISFRRIYRSVMIGTGLVLLFVVVMSWFLAVRRYKRFEFLHYRKSWQATAPGRICRLERVFQCRGLSDTRCTDENEACYNCATTTPKSREVPCIQVIRDKLAIVYYPCAIISTLLTILIVVDVVISFFEDKAEVDCQPSYVEPDLHV